MTFAPVYQHPRHENRTSPELDNPKNTDALRSARYRGGREGIIGKERASSHVGAATYQRPIAHCRLIWLHCLSNIPPACQPDMAARLRDGNGFAARIRTELRTAPKTRKGPRFVPKVELQAPYRSSGPMPIQAIPILLHFTPNDSQTQIQGICPRLSTSRTRNRNRPPIPKGPSDPVIRTLRGSRQGRPVP